MMSDPKVPLATESTGLGEIQSASEAPVRPSAPPPALGPSVSPAHVWLRRIGVLLFVFLCATVGVMLIMLPWRPEWTDNHLLRPYPTLRSIMSNGFVRGVCTGLGVLNVWIGFQEAIQYRED
ncbi:MAG: hypothetical protein LAO22_05290 [Acidobacteriia bacterium]|nr:hypothetical protein [Terriglobia bacterium]